MLNHFLIAFWNLEEIYLLWTSYFIQTLQSYLSVCLIVGSLGRNHISPWENGSPHSEWSVRYKGVITGGQHTKVETHGIFILHILDRAIFLGKPYIAMLGKIFLKTIVLPTYISVYPSSLYLYPLIVIADCQEDDLVVIVVVTRSNN